MRKILWQELKRSEFADAVRSEAVVVIPVGAMEQHGDHLPVDTDTDCCFTIARRAALAIDEFPVLVLPPIWTGYSPYHMCYPGTITLAYHTFVELLTDVIVSVQAHGFRNVLVLNGHGGNSPMVASMRRKAEAQGCVGHTEGVDYWGLPSVAAQMKSASANDKGSIGHAGEIETSLQLYLRPDLVGTNAIWVDGVKGDPSVGTAAKGETILRSAVEALVTLIRDFHSGDLARRRRPSREIA